MDYLETARLKNIAATRLSEAYDRFRAAPTHGALMTLDAALQAYAVAWNWQQAAHRQMHSVEPVG